MPLLEIYKLVTLYVEHLNKLLKLQCSSQKGTKTDVNKELQVLPDGLKNKIRSRLTFLLHPNHYFDSIESLRHRNI